MITSATTREQAVIDAGNEILHKITRDPEQTIDAKDIRELIAGLEPEQQFALIIRLGAAHRSASRQYQGADIRHDAASAVVWGLTMAMLSEAIEALTREIPGMEDTVASSSSCEWLAGEAKRYLLLKTASTLILPPSVQG